MKITVAIDSFKGSLSSLEAGRAAREGIRRVFPSAEVQVRPLADGGEGTVRTLTAGLGGRLCTVEASDPLGRPRSCQYGILETPQKTAVIEMAEAAGLTLIHADQTSILDASTFGVGELIRDAIAEGCRRFLIGLGGSATNDGGIGMLQALGFEILDENHAPVPRGARGLSRIASISGRAAMPELAECTFRVACDVDNPLCGPRGCSAVFGPQKGAGPDLIPRLDQWLSAFHRTARTIRPAADPSFPGCGAGGGMGYAFRTFLNASLEPGARLILEETGLSALIRASDLVVTGEGRLDGQTAMGKAPIAVARNARDAGRPVIAFSGCVANDAGVCNDAGIDAFFPILRSVTTLEDALSSDNAFRNLADTAEQVFRLIRAVSPQP